MKKQLTLSVLAFISFAAVHAQTVQTLWSATTNGGAGGGTIFSMNTNGTGFSHVYDFNYATGCNPYGNLMQASDGLLYGTCENGGPSGSCVIDRFDPVTGIYTDVHDFYTASGYIPFSGLTELNGKLWGVTLNGGASQYGVLYSYDLGTGTYTDEHDFSTTTGDYSYSAVTVANGQLYGITEMGGLHGDGVIYSFDPAGGGYTVLYDLDSTDGNIANTSLLFANSKFYGVTYSGGANNYGTLFCYDESTDTFTKLHDFAAATGSNPMGGIAIDGSGRLLGTTSTGGASNYGVVWRYDLSTNTYTNIHDFSLTDGANPQADLSWSPNGLLYGTTYYGGTGTSGTIFSVDPATGNFSTVFDFSNSTSAGSRSGFCVVTTPLSVSTLTVPANDVSIFPSPAKNFINVNVAVGSGKTTFTIHNSLGQIVKSWTEENVPANYSKQIDIENLDKGVYFLSMSTDAGTATRRFVKE